METRKMWLRLGRAGLAAAPPATSAKEHFLYYACQHHIQRGFSLCYGSRGSGRVRFRVKSPEATERTERVSSSVSIVNSALKRVFNTVRVPAMAAWCVLVNYGTKSWGFQLSPVENGSCPEMNLLLKKRKTQKAPDEKAPFVNRL